MPAFCTHYLFAKKMLPALEQAAMPIPLQEQAVYLGAQGPDVFLFHRLIFPGKSYRKVSSFMHRMPPSLLFDAMAEAIANGNEPERLLSYAYGFLCHYALDCTVHPYVYAKQAALKKRYPFLSGFTLHNRVEFGLDTVLLQEQQPNRKVRQFRTDLLLSNDLKLLEEISLFLERVIHKAMPGWEAEQGKLMEAWVDFRKMQWLLRDGFGLVRPALQVLEVLLLPMFAGFFPSSMLRPKGAVLARKRYFNLEHLPWRAPAAPGRVRTESFPDLWNEAEQLAYRLFPAFDEAVCSGASMQKATGNRSFLTGEPVK